MSARRSPRWTCWPSATRQTRHRAVDRRHDGVLHLHRLDDHHRRVGGHRLALRHAHRDHAPGHRGGEHGGASIGAARGVPRGLFHGRCRRHPELERLAVDVDVRHAVSGHGGRVRSAPAAREAALLVLVSHAKHRVGVQPPATAPRRAFARPQRVRRGQPVAHRVGAGGGGRSSVPTVSVRISPSRMTGWSSSQRRKRRLVRTPRTVVASSASRSRSSAAARVRAVSDQLGDHRVVSVGDGVALLDARVDPHARSATRAAGAARSPAGSPRRDPPRRDAPRSRGHGCGEARPGPAPRATRRPRCAAGRRRCPVR